PARPWARGWLVRTPRKSPQLLSALDVLLIASPVLSAFSPLRFAVYSQRDVDQNSSQAAFRRDPHAAPLADAGRPARGRRPGRGAGAGAVRDLLPFGRLARGRLHGRRRARDLRRTDAVDAGRPGAGGANPLAGGARAQEGGRQRHRGRAEI